MINCPLCTSANTRQTDVLSRQFINDLYNKEYNFDASKLITSDISEHECADCHLKFFNPCITADASLYTHLQTFPWYYPTEKFEHNLVKKWITPSCRVLEVGCGSGQFAKKIKSKHYTGLEFNPNVIDGVNILDQTIEQHSASNSNSYDFVVAFQVLEHVADPRTFIQSCLKCLRVGGTLVLAVPAESSWLGSVRSFALNMPPHHVSKWSDETIIAIAKLFNIQLDKLVASPFRSDAYELKFVTNITRRNGGEIVVGKFSKLFDQ